MYPAWSVNKWPLFIVPQDSVNRKNSLYKVNAVT